MLTHDHVIASEHGLALVSILHLESSNSNFECNNCGILEGEVREIKARCSASWLYTPLPPIVIVSRYTGDASNRDKQAPCNVNNNLKSKIVNLTVWLFASYHYSFQFLLYKKCLIPLTIFKLVIEEPILTDFCGQPRGGSLSLSSMWC